MKTIEFKHQVPIQIRFNDIDALKHVNNTAYFEYCDYARLQYFECIGGKAISLDQPEWVIASIKMDFIHPIFLYDPIVVKTSVYRIGTKSLQMCQQIEDLQGDVKAISYSVMVRFNGVESIAVENTLKEVLSNYETHLEIQ